LGGGREQAAEVPPALSPPLQPKDAVIPNRSLGEESLLYGVSVQALIKNSALSEVSKIEKKQYDLMGEILDF